MNSIHKNRKKGFTLLEIILVIAAIGILASIVLVAINPNRQLAQVRNAERRSEINTIYKALEQYLIDKGSYPAGITTAIQDICNTGSQKSTDTLSPTTLCDNKTDLRVLVPDYIAAIPIDPGGGAYRVGINAGNNRVIVYSGGELGRGIGVNGVPYAIGGDSIYTINVSGTTYMVHEFRTVGTSLLNILESINIEYLIVAGGGAGGSGGYGQSGGGGGGGGMLEGQTFFSPGSVPIIVGGGGVGTTNIFSTAPNGNDSSLSNIVAIGGGGGGGVLQNGASGGSGGGGGTTNSGTTFGGLGVAGQGNNGGIGTFQPIRYPGGGGGASSAGVTVSGLSFAGNGLGRNSSITGLSVPYAEGGKGIIADSSTNAKGTSASANTGNGGDGTRYLGSQNTSDASGGNGGSGIVIVRYKL